MLAKPRIFRHLCPRVSGCLVVSFVTLVCNISFVRAETIHATYAQPQIDRWMYPFNGTPGTRPTISTFGSTPGTPEFDSRDGQFVMAFATSPQVPSSLGSNHYAIVSATVTIEYANDFVVAYDPNQDPWQAFVGASDSDHQADPDVGQPIELFGCGFRNGFSASNFVENAPFSTPPNPMAPSVRNAFAMSFDASGAAIDVSNSPRQRFDPRDFAVGTIDGLTPGELIPIGSVMTFAIDVSHPEIQHYLRTSLNAGRLFFVATSLTFVEQQGGNFPAFYSKENPLVQLLLAHPASLELTVELLSCQPSDTNCDGSTNGLDLAAVLSNWGTSGAGDINVDGITDGIDLTAILSGWSN